ncbi:hypothetical protein PAAG_07988 [Paracoccidioides lutzii Pb01]|uniref:Uncharacterized protein n=1 Tax=Paracoccidioides lutzii (strain ATCC MYA-826 / Pb01) TaxID=502779 RepID=C1HB47_PARBA|nr:hypothetical protein PAAG_07988 [Paracoccidioides lutzii Pb01]EEH37570.2 hypothetical protein PAAG_07988 [Paracoccidioides lutzii Pb01]
MAGNHTANQKLVSPHSDILFRIGVSSEQLGVHLVRAKQEARVKTNQPSMPAAEAKRNPLLSLCSYLQINHGGCSQDLSSRNSEAHRESPYQAKYIQKRGCLGELMREAFIRSRRSGEKAISARNIRKVTEGTLRKFKG